MAPRLCLGRLIPSLMGSRNRLICRWSRVGKAGCRWPASVMFHGQPRGSPRRLTAGAAVGRGDAGGSSVGTRRNDGLVTSDQPLSRSVERECRDAADAFLRHCCGGHSIPSSALRAGRSRSTVPDICRARNWIQKRLSRVAFATYCWIHPTETEFTTAPSPVTSRRRPSGPGLSLIHI